MKGLLFITHQTERYDYLQSVRIALEGGCRKIQLRMKETSLDILEDTAHKAKYLCDLFKAELYIDDHVMVCKQVKATGVHLGKLDMPPENAREILGKNFIIGGTANTFEDIKKLQAAGVDYIGLGPFRYTATKKNLSPVLGLEGYAQIMNQCRQNAIQLPVLAIGGIASDDIPAIMLTGVSGIALSSAVLNSSDPIEELKKIVRLMEKAG